MCQDPKPNNMAVDPESYKSGMRCLAASVCIVTTVGADGRRSGLTATAVCSVSLAPPTLLCCVNRQSGSYSAIHEAGVFAVNVLSAKDRHLAERFAGSVSGEARFAEGRWSTLHTGAPILGSALASFDCRISQAVELPTHGILFGEIEAVKLGAAAGPLLYAHGDYGDFVPLKALLG
jgi:flavin reductase (DIM6/NTAB) family NADH-FMN oxidoreductase RutF